MSLKVISLGAIGTLVETSDMQRRAYNQAIREAGLTWEWDPARYAELLAISGGRKRLRHYAEQTNTPLSDEQITQIHARKSEVYQDMLRDEGVALRPGIATLIDATRAASITLVWSTGTSQDNIDAIVAAAGDALALDMFDLVMNDTMLSARKPDPETYYHIMAAFNVGAAEIIAIEDTAVSAQAPVAAGVPVVVTPGAYAQDQDFSHAVAVDTTGKIADIAWLQSLLAQRVQIKN